MEINPNAKFNICYKRLMFVKHGGIDSFLGILRMTSVRVLHMLFCDLQVSQDSFDAIACLGKQTITKTCKIRSFTHLKVV